MRLRHFALAGVAVIAAAIAYAAFAPGPTAPVPASASSINVSAEAGGSAAWTSYQITVRNLGDHDFFGSLLLYADVPAGQGAGNLRLPNVRSLQSLPGLLPGLLPRSQLDRPDAAYEVHLGLLARHRHTFTIQAPGPPLFTLVAVRDQNGFLVAGPEVVSVLRTGVGIGLLSDDATAAGELERARIGELGLRVTTWARGDGFPRSLLGLAGFAAVVVDRFDVAGLDAAQLNALRDYVELGGSLLIGGGDLARTLRGLPNELTPLSAVALRVEGLEPLAGLYAGGLFNTPAVVTGGTTATDGTNAQEAVATGDLAGSARVLLAAADGVPLLAERDYGAGRVVEMLFDARTLASRYQRLEDEAWATAVGSLLQRTGRDLPDPGILMDASALPDSVLPQASDAPVPPLWLVGALILFYLALAVPLNYWTTRRLHMPALFWASAPALAVIFSLMAYVLGQFQQGGVHDQQIHLLKIAPNGVYSDYALHGVVFPERGAHIVRAQAGDETAPLTSVFTDDASATCANCPAARPAAAGAPAEHSLPLAGGAVREDGVVYGSVRVVGTASHGKLQPGLSVRLTAGPGPGQLTGTIANTGAQPVGDLAIYTYYDGGYRWLPLVRQLNPGEQVQVDGSFRVLPSSSFASGVTPLLWEAGEGAVNGAGQVAVAGLLAPPVDNLRVDGAGIDSVAIGAFATPVTLIGSADPHGSFTRTSPLALSSSAGGWSGVYALFTPPIAGRPALDFSDSVYSSVEVWDASAQAWRQVVGGAPLSASEMSSGLVVVRATEPGTQPTWGSGLRVASLP